jgi:hypothetical protein
MLIHFSEAGLDQLTFGSSEKKLMEGTETQNQLRFGMNNSP